MLVPLLLAGLLPAQASTDWETVGPGTGLGEVLCCQIAVSPDNVVHVAYQDLGLQGRAVVRRLEGIDWTDVGPVATASVGQAWYDRIGFRPGGEVLLASRDYGVSGKANVRRYRPATGTWTNFGDWGASAGEAHFTDFATAPDGTSYLVFADRTTSPADRATVRRSDGGAWTVVGAPGASAAPAEYTSIAIAPDGAPWIAFADAAHAVAGGTGKVTVLRWNASAGAWEIVGAPGFSSAPGLNARLAFDRSGRAHVAYQHYHLAIVVLRFDGAQWVELGGSASGPDRPTIETEPWRQWLSLAFDSQDQPYLAYQRFDDARRLAVRRFDGSQWVPVGSPGFSPPDADYHALAIDRHDVPWVVFRDSTNGRAARVMRFAPSPWRYGTTGPSAEGCEPGLSMPSTTTVSAAGLPSQRNGMLLYGFAPAHVPFQGSYMLLAPPIRRTPLQNSGGTPGGGDCTGAFTTDFSALVASGQDPLLVQGAFVFAQYWYRDPLGPASSALTGGLRFQLGL